MGIYKFGSKELCKCLIKLKFVPNKTSGSSHQKYGIPGNKKALLGQRPFIIVILGRRQYDPHTCSGYIRQIKNLGFKSEEIDRYL
jgi:hypothetical protein